MKILTNRSCCKVIFEEDEKYFGKTLLVDGEGNLEGDFCVQKALIHQMCWADTSNVGTNRFVLVDAELREEVLSYVIKEAQKQGLSISLW